MKAVFLDYATFSTAIDLSPIRASVSELVFFPLTGASQIVDRAHDADIIITNKVVLTQSVLEQLPKLKLICVAATGTNNIDLLGAKQQRITVTNAKDYAGTSVAQYVFSQLLNLYQDISHHNDLVSKGHWSNSPTFCLHDKPIQELSGKTLGILGYGHIGQAVAKLAEAIGMQVLIAERPLAESVRSQRVSFSEMLTNADIVSLHCPLTKETDALFGQQTISKMKKGAVLVNTARGALVDNTALKQALMDGQLGHAILDVLNQEPPAADHILLDKQLTNITITGHIAWASQQAQQRLINIIGDNITHFFRGDIINQVN